MITDIDHVMLAAPRCSEPEAKTFYGDLLGLQEVEKPEPLKHRGGCWFQVGSRQLHIGVEDAFVPAKKAHIALVSNDLDGLMAKLEKAGIACQWDHLLVDVRRFYADDPWGNRLEFMAAKSGHNS